MRRPAKTAAVLSVFFATCGAASIAEAQSPPAAPESFALGDWQIAPAVEIRTRGDYRRDPPDVGGIDSAGRSSPRVRDEVALYERSRLGVAADRGVLHAVLTLQDVHGFGAPPPTARLVSGDAAASFGAYEAYFGAQTSAARPSFVRVGRQAVVWGDGMLLGNADASPTARTLDAVRGQLVTGRWELELLAAVLETPHPFGVAADDTSGPTRLGAQLYGARAQLTTDPLVKIEVGALARIARTDGGDGSRFSVVRASGETYTGWARVAHDGTRFRFGVQGAYQLGTARALAAEPVDIRAFMLAANVGTTLDQVALTPSFSVGAAYASGDDGSSTTYTQFDPILPDVHTAFGPTDWFALSNVAEVHARAAVVPFENAQVALEYRYAELAQATGDWVGAYMNSIGRVTIPPLTQCPCTVFNEKSLGHEADVVFAWRPSTSLALLAGYSGLLLGDGARTVLAAQGRGGASDGVHVTPPNVAHAVYVQATLRIPQ